MFDRTTLEIAWYKDNVRCVPAAQNPSACFLFQLPFELEPDDLTTVELWIYKERDRLDQHNHTFVVSEVAHWDINHSTQETKLLTIKDTDVKEGWVKIDLAWVVKNWLEYQELIHALFIECKSCANEVARSPISLQPDRKPFLIIRTSSVNKLAVHLQNLEHKISYLRHGQIMFLKHLLQVQGCGKFPGIVSLVTWGCSSPSSSIHPNNVGRRRRRSKRHVNCVPGVSECCRENLYISFEEIGWDDWILHPTGYQAYFCRGSCSNAASLTVSGSHYNSIIRKLLYQGRPNNKRIDLVPCCTATHLSSIQLLYMDNNQALTQKTLPNMVVDSCGCM
uniref:TGF-beta family profile domain-containing protein n=1 Tax=Timema cristinae TaxID=61476 RepID=A0A7R9GY89_TIMCR|nr:unnamed protein product [Timema cristinae]